MDLNDPRRRLQVLQANNPSLRASAAPQQPLNVSVAPAQNLSVDVGGGRQPVQIARDPSTNTSSVAQQNTTKFQPNETPGQAALHFIGDTVKSTVQPFGGFIARSLPGGQADIAANEQAQASQNKDLQFYNDLYKQGRITKDQYSKFLLNSSAGYSGLSHESQRIAGTADISQALGSAAQVLSLPFAPEAAGAKSLLARSGISAAEGAGFGAANDATVNKDPTLKGTLTGAAAGGVLGGLLPGIGGLFSKAGQKLFGNSTSKVVSAVAQETDPAVIQQSLHVSDDVANYLASETDKKAIETVVKQIQVDPSLSIPQGTQDTLKKGGITDVNQGDTPYGAEYDGNGVIKLRDQSFATNDDLYHELGHHLWQNQLTPEERAVFENIHGPGYQQAVKEGRTGYDLASEDFANDVKIYLSGQGDNLPPEILQVVKKYAGDIQQSVAQQQDQALRFTPAGHNAKDVVKQPGQVARAITRAADPNSSDSLQTVMNAIAQSPNKGEVRKMIEGLKIPISGTEKNRLVKDLTTEKDPQKVVERLNKEIDNYYANAPASEQPVAPPVEPTPNTPQDTGQQIAAAPPQSGVSDIAPNGARINYETGSVETPGRKFTADAKGNTTAQPTSDNTSDIPNSTSSAEKAAKLFPQADPESHKAIAAVMDSLDNAQASYDSAATARSAEKGQRSAAMTNSYEAAGGGEAGVQAKMKALKGAYSKSDYTPISVDPQVEKTLLDHIEKSDLMPFEKLNTQNALRKVWGTNPEKPAAHDITYIRKFFDTHYGEGTGEEMAKGINELLASGDATPQDVATQLAGLPRALMATGDFSGGGRQAAPLGTRFPKIWANANKESVKYFFKPKYFEQEMRKIENASDFELISDKMNVALPGAGTNQEEQFIGAGYAEKLNLPTGPRGDRFSSGIGPGTVVQASDRAYTGIMTRIRYDVSHQLVEEVGGAEKYLQSMENLYGDKSDKAMQALGEVINTFTGRGGKKGGLVDAHMKSLTTTLFAPRLWAGNINRLNPLWYIRLARTNPSAAKLALQTQGTFMATVATVLGLASAAGYDVGHNMLSADFGKIKVGNTRYDMMGGQQQNIRYAAQMWTGKKIDSTTGEVQTIGDGYTAKTRKDITYDLFEGKENPLIGFATKMLSTKIDKGGNVTDEYGKPFNKLTEAAKLFIPLNVSGIAETANDTGSLKDPKNLAKAVAMNLPGFGGIGVQTYGNIKTKDTKAADSAGSIYPTDNASLEKQAALNSAKTKNNSKLAEGKLSAADKSIYNIGNKDKSLLNADQLDKYNQIKKWVGSYGKSQDIPDGAKTQQAGEFYQKWNSMTKKDQDAWLKQKPDANAKAIADGVNKMRSDGLSEFKPSNELSKAYAEYEKDINTHPDYTEIDKRNKAKAFQKFAYRLNYNQNQRDLYSEGGSSDTKALYEDGKISKEDLAAAVKMDDELYNSGLAGSLKFSKTFRNAYGFGLPDGGKGGNGSAAGSSGSSSPNAHLTSLLPSFRQGGSKPEFSSRDRHLTFKGAGVSQAAQRGGSGKKITIKL